MADPQFSGQVNLPNDGQIPSVNNPEPNDMSQVLANRVVPANIPVQTPISPVSTQSTPNPEVPAERDHLMGRMVGRLMSGLTGQHTEYNIDPNTGATVPKTVKNQPGSVFKSILAYGLLGGQGIGPKEGEQTFSQGLLAGLGSGVRTSMTENERLDKERRAQAQQQYANQLKAQEEARANKELTMKQQLNNAAIANYTSEKVLRDFQLLQAQQDNQLSAVKQMVSKDATMYQAYLASKTPAIKEGHTAEEFEKLIADNKSGINAHTVIPVVTGYEPHTGPDGKITWEPIGNLYPPGTKYTDATLSQLKDAGYKETDPLYKDVAQKVTNETPIEPIEWLTTAKEIRSHFQDAKDRAATAKEDAERIRALSEAGEAGIRSQMAKLQLDQAKSAELGKELFNKIGTDEIPATGDGVYDFSKIKDPKQKAALRDYLDVRQQVAAQEFEKIEAASKADPENADIKKELNESAQTLSTLSVMSNSINGTKNPPGVTRTTVSPIAQIQGKYASGLSSNNLKIYNDITKGGNNTPPTATYEEALNKIKALQGNVVTQLQPDDMNKVLEALRNYYNEATPVARDMALKARESLDKSNAALKDEQDSQQLSRFYENQQKYNY